MRDIIVCGFALGAMKGILDPDGLKDLPSVAGWLSHLSRPHASSRKFCDLGLTDEQFLSVSIRENVLVQIDNLRTHPAVSARLIESAINLHAWTYKMETGEVFATATSADNSCQSRRLTFALPNTEKRRLPTRFDASWIEFWRQAFYLSWDR
ncbi:MAG: hypothetical protein IPI39_25395 [Candidatus Obscuribacter sp.]|nr:hypothetical protein [Candidatus Obscuribacter sp.]